MALHHNPRIVTDGLVLALDAADTNSYPGSGTTWNDLSGNNLSGSLINGPTTDGRSITFDGTNDYVQLGTLPQIGSGSFTAEVAFRINKTPTISDDGLFNINDNTSQAQGYYLWISPTYTDLHYIVVTENGVDLNKRSNIRFNLNQNYTISFTYQKNITDGSKVYVNGELFESFSTVGFGSIINTLEYVIGTRISTGITNLFGGSIFSVKHYNRALTASEVLQNYNATKTRFGL